MYKRLIYLKWRSLNLQIVLCCITLILTLILMEMYISTLITAPQFPHDRKWTNDFDEALNVLQEQIEGVCEDYFVQIKTITIKVNL